MKNFWILWPKGANYEACEQTTSALWKIRISEIPKFVFKADFFSEKWLLVGRRGGVNNLGRSLEKRFLVLY